MNSDAPHHPATVRAAWDVLRPGGTAVVVGLAPAGVEVSLPAIEFPTIRIIASRPGADPATMAATAPSMSI